MSGDCTTKAARALNSRGPRTAGRSNGDLFVHAKLVPVVVPHEQRWLFWDVDPDALEPERDKRYILARVLERGRLADVRWAVEVFGLEAIRNFFKAGGHPELSRRTLALWTAFFDDQGPWLTSSSWRQTSAAPWIE